MKHSVVRTMTLTAILTALYVVLGAFIKLPLIGNVSIDLGYIALITAVFTVGPFGAGFVGAVGALLESLLFSAYGISIGWVVMNLTIGLLCGMALASKNYAILYPEQKIMSFSDLFWTAIVIAISVFAGGGLKMIIECALYNIPYIVKLPKIAIACGLDIAVMLIGLSVACPVAKYWNKHYK